MRPGQNPSPGEHTAALAALAGGGWITNGRTDGGGSALGAAPPAATCLLYCCGAELCGLGLQLSPATGEATDWLPVEELLWCASEPTASACSCPEPVTGSTAQVKYAGESSSFLMTDMDTKTSTTPYRMRQSFLKERVA